MTKLVSEWLVPEESPHCAMRVLAGADPSVIGNRVAFIEKTARIRVLPLDPLSARDDCYNWHAGPKGDDGHDAESRAWCDAALRHNGYVLPEEALAAPAPAFEPDQQCTGRRACEHHGACLYGCAAAPAPQPEHAAWDDCRQAVKEAIHKRRRQVMTALVEADLWREIGLAFEALHPSKTKYSSVKD